MSGVGNPYRMTTPTGRRSLRRTLEATAALIVFASLLCVPFVVGVVTEGPRSAWRFTRRAWRDVRQLARAHGREEATP